MPLEALQPNCQCCSCVMRRQRARAAVEPHRGSTTASAQTGSSSPTGQQHLERLRMRESHDLDRPWWPFERRSN